MHLLRKPLLAGALGVALTATATWADEVRLTDGRVLVGRARIDGEVVRVATRDQTVVVPRAEVVRIRTDAELTGELDRLRQMAGQHAHAWLEIARRARLWQFEDAMWNDLGRCLSLSVDEDARGRLDAFLADLEPEILPKHRLRAPVATRVTELLHRVRPDVPPVKIAAVEAILVAMPDDGAEDALRKRAREAVSDLQRLAAVNAIQRRGADDAERFVWRTTVFDPSRDVRATVARRVAQDAQRDAAVDYLALGLFHERPDVRIRTAEAYANLGGIAAVSHLVAAGPAVPADGLSGGSTRAYAAFIDQQAYIRDFNVEVAMASFIADPVVDALQSGTVLDVTVHSVIAYRTHILGAYRSALRRLTGDDPGPDPDRWAAWLASRDSGS